MKCMCLGNLFNFLKNYINSTYYTKMFLKHGNEKKNKMIFKLSLKLTEVITSRIFIIKYIFYTTIIFNLKNIVDLTMKSLIFIPAIMKEGDRKY